MLTAVSLLASCHVGPQIESLPAAVQPHGASVELDFHKNSPHRSLDISAAELLEVSDDGILLALRVDDADPRLTLVPWSVLARISATELTGIRWKFGLAEKYVQKNREELRLVSRFPQGLSGPLRARLAALYGQSEVETLGQ